jgi:D-alanyl-D-alanine carboxypeptidase/D-alanyl-D-alanine-endopeptidase (penicillin-binding protein 4)
VAKRVLSTILVFVAVASVSAQSRETLAERIDAILARPEFRHAIFGIEFYSLETKTVVYEHNADRFFVPGSTTKLVTMGSALQLLGPDYRFKTRVYRTGDVDAAGTLHGDLILVASGDPNLSGRIRPDETLAFENVDHSYGGPDSHGLEGDPLAVVRELAGQTATHGVKRIEGRVIVDATLYAEGERDGGTGFVISPIMINDNAVDVVVRPGAAAQDPAVLDVSPKTAYVTFVNNITTANAGGDPRFRVASDVAAGDGTRTVTLSGTIPADAKPVMSSYRVAQPPRFAEIVLAEALHERGVSCAARRYEDKPDFANVAQAYTDERAVAEHVSPPLSEEVKVTLKVSQNLHASATPFLLGAVLAHKGTAAAGFGEMKKFLATTGADVSGASQSDGAGADAHFTPAFMTAYLVYLAQQPSAKLFHDALPVLGKDGTLWNIQTKSPAAGHVHAKTGTFQVRDLLHDAMMVTGKGLAGYMTTVDGQRLAFAIYANNVEVRDPGAVTAVGDALGSIAAAAYGAKIDRRRRSE